MLAVQFGQRMSAVDTAHAVSQRGDIAAISTGPLPEIARATGRLKYEKIINKQIYYILFVLYTLESLDTER